MFGDFHKLAPGADHRLHQRGDEEGQPLGAGHDQHHLDQRDELRGVEQERGAGVRTSHQTLEGKIVPDDHSQCLS